MAQSQSSSPPGPTQEQKDTVQLLTDTTALMGKAVNDKMAPLQQEQEKVNASLADITKPDPVLQAAYEAYAKNQSKENLDRMTELSQKKAKDVQEAITAATQEQNKHVRETDAQIALSRQELSEGLAPVFKNSFRRDLVDNPLQALHYACTTNGHWFITRDDSGTPVLDMVTTTPDGKTQINTHYLGDTTDHLQNPPHEKNVLGMLQKAAHAVRHVFVHGPSSSDHQVEKTCDTLVGNIARKQEPGRGK